MPTPKLAAHRILCLYTGGTIGCMPSPLGLAPAAGILQQPLQQLTRASHRQTIELTLREYPQLLDSSSMQAKDWLRIAQDIHNAYDHFDGFIVLHGTDTLAWTAAALHWQLAHIAKPVVITGSQRPWHQAGTDAIANVELALQAATGEQTGVIVAFGGQLLPGYAVKKLDADADAAFAAPNWDGIWPNIPRENYHFQALDPSLAILPIKLFPGTESWLAHSLTRPDIKGIVIESYGSGNLPSNTPLESALLQLAQQGTVVINCTQCLRGEVRQGHYAAGNFMQQIKALPAGKMSIEAATTWLYTAIKPDSTQDSLAKAWQSAQLVV
ncbi:MULTISPECIES: asparaginase [Deefgea]|uniref:Asparaginase n=1 Tax=Deefgea chitinilytica TaxID=570276 RepID=A0ABS2CB21_9NEIS|nr:MULTISPECIES: asparaginase [Deefgea]MBM5571344.1 asparaginase [Deefgea chitinilytica]MBM9888577.1 asparaginase [Deefgea sp. CFH1-16]